MGKRKFEWSDLNFFLELARTGSPSAAARRLKADHTTVRRRIAALESALQARLISSGGSNYELTPEGDRLLGYAEAIEALASRAEEEIANKNLEISGTVRVGTLDGLATRYLAPRLAKFAAENPELEIQLVVMPWVVNLANREADIAISLSPPNQLRQIVRRLGDFGLGLYATDDYLKSAPAINSLDDLAGHKFTSYIPDLLYDGELDFLPELNPALSSSFESTSILVQIEAVAAGTGISILPNFLASEDSRLVPILPDKFSLTRELWLIIHPEMVNLARVRAVIDFVSECIRRDRALFMGNQVSGNTISEEQD